MQMRLSCVLCCIWIASILSVQFIISASSQSIRRYLHIGEEGYTRSIHPEPSRTTGVAEVDAGALELYYGSQVNS